MLIILVRTSLIRLYPRRERAAKAGCGAQPLLQTDKMESRIDLFGLLQTLSCIGRMRLAASDNKQNVPVGVSDLVRVTVVPNTESLMVVSISRASAAHRLSELIFFGGGL
jgi:hypothetical protein